MRLTVLGFASVSDLIGRRPVVVESESGTSVAALKQHLEARFVGLAEHWEGLAVAVNGEIADDTRTLEDGDEIALLPPVSGGAPDRSNHLTREPIDSAAVAERVRDPGHGAVVLFLGDVRNSNDGRPVDGITYSAYESMAESRLATICRELEAEGGCRVAVVHRLGELAVGETSVVIAVSSAHRAAAYDVSRLALERLKAEVPIWKREHYVGGDSAWREVEPLGADPA